MLMEVVPSTPPLIAVTCTTELSLFRLDGKRLPVVAVADTPRRGPARDDDNTFGEAEIGGGDSTGSSSLPGRRFAYGVCGSDHDEIAAATGVAAAEGHQRDIRCLAASPSGEMVATG